jgi:hypothetical protein
MKKKKLKTLIDKSLVVINVLVIIFILFASLYPTIYWFSNPELTSMEIFIEFWWLYLILLGSYFTYSYFYHK